MPAPTSSRDKGRTSKQGRSDEEFVLFLQGIPAHCRWQELKDLVRQTALHIRQAVVYDDQHGFPTGLGQIIVKNEDEAWRTYQRLSTTGWEGQSLVVTLARTSSPTRPVAGPTKSPTCLVPANYIAGYSTPPRVTQNMAVPPSPISPEPAISTSPTYPNSEYGPVIDLISIPHHHQPFLPVFADPVTQHAIPAIPQSPAPLRHNFRDAFAIPILPSYPLPAVQPFVEGPISTRFGTTAGRQTNFPRKPIHNYHSDNVNFTSQAYHQPSSSAGPPHFSPRRTIFVQNLSPATSGLALRDLFQASGVAIEQCEVPLDTESGRCRGFARVTFRTAEEAKRTIALYNGCTFLGARIRVKIDRSMLQNTSNPPLDPVNFTKTSTNTSIRNHNPLRQSNMQVKPPTSASKDHRRGPPTEDASRSEATAPTTSRDTSPPASPSSSTSTAAKQTDRCGPLVVNGSGTGRRAVAT
ncbi:hypothetical protein ASPACDRAFT_77969 [Aspergillus aculeatus ATCC 16872]|uniref:RRM domain-containing protein n=1 Tax=Aspergillus aculeatus (strain ATCC 16872 / CBS 172.66 / WB 5094) TaxID=690307 RepID=A0A1L9WXZ6_ASPA1|nr:uncharacterized protein ASPACDRAFT_77969 [Aspergillus aculeatus ATCC 16872]OJK01081.1 hypothetical protein ASPACDRAFT_77969 [Aspergillus aculeatus ATCC 16872]